MIARKPKSLLCQPILRNGVLTGVLYLENSASTDVFTPERVELLGILAAQAAISLDNARLYDQREKALEAAKESARLKGEFLAKTSHELRTPLTSIINVPKMVLQAMTRQPGAVCSRCSSTFALDPGEQAHPALSCARCGQTGTLVPSAIAEYRGNLIEVCEYMEMLVKSGTLLLQVVNNILDFSKLEAGREVLQVETFPIRQVVDEVLAATAVLADQKEVAFDLATIPEDLELTADRIKITQILLNLLGNAVKFSPRGSHVLLEVKQTADQIQFVVKDQGIGIAAENQALIFESFRQVDGGPTRRFGGVGLGLAITRSLVELHGGQILVHSALGQGSEFTVALPRQGRPDADNRTSSPPRSTPPIEPNPGGSR